MNNQKNRLVLFLVDPYLLSEKFPINGGNSKVNNLVIAKVIIVMKMLIPITTSKKKNIHVAINVSIAVKENDGML